MHSFFNTNFPKPPKVTHEFKDKGVTQLQSNIPITKEGTHMFHGKNVAWIQNAKTIFSPILNQMALISSKIDQFSKKMVSKWFPPEHKPQPSVSGEFMHIFNQVSSEFFHIEHEMKNNLGFKPNDPDFKKKFEKLLTDEQKKAYYEARDKLTSKKLTVNLEGLKTIQKNLDAIKKTITTQNLTLNQTSILKKANRLKQQPSFNRIPKELQDTLNNVITKLKNNEKNLSESDLKNIDQSIRTVELGLNNYAQANTLLKISKKLISPEDTIPIPKNQQEALSEIIDYIESFKDNDFLPEDKKSVILKEYKEKLFDIEASINNLKKQGKHNPKV